MCKVSILVPIYNVEKYLDKCLFSLEKQDLEDLEIICLNDGSTDKFSAIIHAYADRDTRFRVVDKENSGYGMTMNLGLSLARGEYIGIVESDDFVEADMFSSLLNLAEKYKADVVKSSFWIYNNGNDIYEASLASDRYDEVLVPNDVMEVYYRNPSIWSNLYRKSFLEKNGIKFLESPGASFQDMAWRVKVFTTADKLVFTKRAFYHYRRDNMNASVRTEGKLFCVCDEYDEVERFLSQRVEWDTTYRYLVPYVRWSHYIWNCFGRWLSLGSRWKFYKRMYEEFLQYEQKGLLKRSIWHKEAWYEVQDMLWNYKKFFFDRCTLFLRKCIILEGFWPLLDKAPRLAIYGAGKVGREALAALRIYGRRPPDCFVVTDVSENSVDVDGVQVRGIDDLAIRQSEYVILIATGISTQPEIMAKLLEKGFSNIVPFLPEARQVLI